MTISNERVALATDDGRYLDLPAEEYDVTHFEPLEGSLGNKPDRALFWFRIRRLSRLLDAPFAVTSLTRGRSFGLLQSDEEHWLRLLRSEV